MCVCTYLREHFSMKKKQPGDRYNPTTGIIIIIVMLYIGQYFDDVVTIILFVVIL